jgi:LPXTG-motif cell wall-anchored protein
MNTGSRSPRRSTWLVASISSILLVAASVAFAGAASADASSQGRSQSAQAQGQGGGHSAAAPGHTKVRRSPSGTHSSGGGSAVSLPRPNHFQAQADPDGMENGGVDQPGGQGGVDTTTQDGNNGSGNDTDCEDDNRGVGVPGHCKDRPGHPGGETPEVPPTDTGQTPGTEGPGTPVVDQPSVPGADLPLQVLAPTLGSSTSASPVADTAPLSLTRASAEPASGVLPNTGAGEALLALALGGLATLVVGAGLLLQGRRTVS